MALGLPAICLDWGGPQLLVENGETGYLIKPDDREAVTDQIAEYLDKLVTNDELAEQMSIAGRQRAELWRWTNIIQEWTDRYDCLVAKETSPNFP